MLERGGGSPTRWSLSNWPVSPLISITLYDPFVQFVVRDHTNQTLDMDFGGNWSVWKPVLKLFAMLTHWGWVTHICVSKLTIIGSDNNLSPDRRQAIIWTNAGLLLMGPLGTNFSEIWIEILTFSFKKMRLKVSSAKWRLFRLGLNVLMYHLRIQALVAKYSVWDIDSSWRNRQRL